jgi:putative thioredoxin
MAAHSFDATTASFERDVLEASKQVAVVVDFWAPWCGPCRALKPILEKLAVEYEGKFRLAKLNTDEHPEIAAQFGVRGIPNVKAFVDGKLASEFTGALPESEVRRFLAAVIPSPSENMRRAAQQDLARGDFEAAEAKLRQSIVLDPTNYVARVDLAELLVARQDFSTAEKELEAVPAQAQDDRTERLAARVALWKKGQKLPDSATLRTLVAAHPEDLAARLRYGERLVIEGQYRSALDELLEVVRRDRSQLRDQARKVIVEVFDLATGDTHLVSEYRRRLAALLY